MMDFEAASSKRAIEALGVGDTRKNLLKFGVWLTQSEADAEDLLSDAMGRVCDPEGRPWDPERGSFGAHVRVLMRDLAKAQQRSARVRREEVSAQSVARAVAGAPPPDEALSEARTLERLRRMGRTLRERLSSRPRALQVLDARLEGVERAEEVAELLGCPVQEVYDANRQIAYHAARVRAEERAADDAEMKARRAKAMKDRKP